jgi:hypothetical protein
VNPLVGLSVFGDFPAPEIKVLNEIISMFKMTP